MSFLWLHHAENRMCPKNMLAEARRTTASPTVRYLHLAIEDVDFSPTSFDMAISSLAFHYVRNFAAICGKMAAMLTPGGDFVFSVEHPVFTAQGGQDWHYDKEGGRLHWPVDNYFREGPRETTFLGATMTKYHRTLTTYVQDLLAAGFIIENLVEPPPDETLLNKMPGMRDELRRPMMLLIAAKKPPTTKPASSQR